MPRIPLLSGTRVVVASAPADARLLRPPAPGRATDVEARLNGDANAAVAGLGATLDPPSDVHAPADYRRHLAEVVVARAIEQARSR